MVGISWSGRGVFDETCAPIWRFHSGWCRNFTLLSTFSIHSIVKNACSRTKNIMIERVNEYLKSNYRLIENYFSWHLLDLLLVTLPTEETS